MRRLTHFRAIAAPMAAIILPFYLAACFHYVPVDVAGTPPLGTNVRATLTTPTPFDLGTVTVHDVQALEGRVVEVAGDSVGVWVKWLYPVGGEKYDANSAAFYLHRATIGRLEELRVSARQTAFLVAVSAALVVGMSKLVSAAVGKNGPDTGGDGQMTVRLGR